MTAVRPPDTQLICDFPLELRGAWRLGRTRPSGAARAGSAFGCGRGASDLVLRNVRVLFRGLVDVVARAIRTMRTFGALVTRLFLVLSKGCTLDLSNGTRRPRARTFAQRDH
jgi:hypothetical protein